MPQDAALPTLRIEAADAALDLPARDVARATSPVLVGSDAACDVVVEGRQVRPRHVEAVWEGGAWHVREAGRWNSTYVDGRTVRSVPIAEPVVVRLGWSGPALRFAPLGAHATPGHAASEESASEESASERSASERSASERSASERSASEESASERSASERSAEPAPSPRGASPAASFSGEAPLPTPDASPEQSASPEDGASEGAAAVPASPAGVRRPWLGVVAAVAALAVVAALVGSVWVQVRTARVSGQATELFEELRRHRLALSRLQLAVEAVGGAELDAQIEALAAEQAAMGERYEGLIREFGLYRGLSDEEQLIHRVARVFNESDVAMPASFVGAVREEIRTYWLGPGRSRFARAIARAEATGVTERTVRALQAAGLPPELFYIALQESDFDPAAVGPSTRWGIAKGMWQFIPRTARRFGLRVGPREGLRVVDPLDERHDPAAATDAAARYLRFIYSTEAQSSGLLVIASYNWGEHRVAGRVAALDGPQGIPAFVFEGLPATTSPRSYWDFLTAYRDRMPEETKDYVLKVFAAAVIGENPRLFGFDFDNPLRPYIEGAEAPASEGGGAPGDASSHVPGAMEGEQSGA